MTSDDDTYRFMKASTRALFHKDLRTLSIKEIVP